MPSRSRRYTNVAERVDPDQSYSPEEAIDLLKDLSTAKFDETVELHLRTNVDPRHADQMVRGVVGPAPRHRQDRPRLGFRRG